MGTVDLVTFKGGKPSRLTFVPANVRERRRVLGLPGAVASGKEGSLEVSFPTEPLRVEDMRRLLGFDNVSLTSAASRWLSECHVRSCGSMTLRDKSALSVYVPWSDALHPYQRQGARWLQYVERGILGDDPGLGKTIQSLTAVIGCRNVLIVTLNSVKRHWQSQIEQWIGVTVPIADGTRAARDRVLSVAPPWVIVNHEMLRSGSAGFSQLFDRTWDAVIIDEAHKFQGRQSQMSKGMAKLKTNRLYLLTGTPIWNRPESVWNLLHLLDPQRFSSYWGFISEYCDTFNNGFTLEVIGVKPDQIDRLRSVIAPYLLRRLKRDVLPQLPNKVRVVVEWEPTPAQREQYRKLKKTYQLEATGGIKTAGSVGERTKWMRQLLNFPALVGMFGGSPKDDTIIELLETLEGRKVLVFTWHKDYALYLSAWLKCDVITGDSTLRDERLEAFRRDDKQCLVATIGAIGTGIDMVEASAAIFAEGSHVPALNVQAEDRLHRIGQKTDVTIYRLQAPRTLEASLWRVSDEREDLADELLATTALYQAIEQEDDDD